MKVVIGIAGAFLLALLAVFLYLYSPTGHKASVVSDKSDTSGKVVSIPLTERLAHEAYIVKDQPGGDEVIWIECARGKFYFNRYNLATEQKSVTPLNLPESTYFSGLVFPQQINDVVWMGTNKWLVRIDPETGEHSLIELPATKYAFDDSSGDPLTRSMDKIHAITGFEVDGKGNIWMTRMSASSLTRFTEGSGFQEYQAPANLKEPERPIAIDEGVYIVDTKRTASEFEKSTAQILKTDGKWSKYTPPGNRHVKNIHGVIFVKNLNADLIVNGRQVSSTSTNLTIEGVQGSLLSVGKNDEIWYKDAHWIVRFDPVSLNKLGYFLPINEVDKNIGFSPVFGDGPVPEVKIGSIIDTSEVAKDGSFWASCMIGAQLFIVGVPAE